MITVQPTNQVVSLLGIASFSVGASSSTTMSYQWYKDGNPILLANSSTYTILSVLGLDVGTYSVKVTNSGGSVMSAVATLSLTPTPGIVTAPVSQTVTQGQAASFSVVASGSTPLAYRWSLNGAALPGATTSALVLTNVQGTQAGNYTIVVTNAYGTANAAASLTVYVPAGITTPPQSQTVAIGQNVSFTVTATGTAPLSYQWSFNGNGIPGATSSSLTRTNVQTSDSGRFHVSVSNLYGTATSADATLTVSIPPSIATQPVSRTVYSGQTTGLVVVATGTAPLSYQWKFNGTNLPAATNSSLMWSPVQTNNAGAYSVVVTNLVGSVTSVVTTLTVIDMTLHSPWTAQYNGSWSGSDYLTDVAVDAQGNVYVTGYADMVESKSWDFVTIKYDPASNVLWRAVYSGPVSKGNDLATALAVDGAGNVYVTGASEGNNGWDYATVKYDPNGNQLWVARYDGPAGNDDLPAGLAVDASGNVFVTGSSQNAAYAPQYVTVKYDSAGNQIWVQTYVGPGATEDDANAIAIDCAGNIYVTGQSVGTNSGFDYATIKYSNDGTQLWVARYDAAGKNNQAVALAADASGNVYVTGSSVNSSNNSDYATLKYDGNGNVLWVARYDGPASKNDYAAALAVDKAGNVFVTGASGGTTGPSGSADYATVKYNPQGQQLWAQRYDYGDDDRATALALDPSGDVYVTGKSKSATTGYDFATIKYRSADGTQETVARYNSTGSVNDIAVAIAVDSNYNVYVGGQGFNWPDYVLVKYQPGFLLPAVANLAVSNITITSALLNATVNPQAAATTGSFQYGLTANYGSVAGAFSLPSGTNAVPLAVPLTGLTPGTLYHWCVVATNAAGIVLGQDVVFTTTYLPPVVTALTASNLTTTSALLSATVNPQGTSASFYFQYGPTSSYGSSTTTNGLAATSSDEDVATLLAGLTPNTLYHYAVVAVSSGGISVGQDATFTTGTFPNTISALGVSSVTAGSALLNATVNPQGSAAAWYFHYGPTPACAFVTPTNTLAADASSVAVSAAIAGLNPGSVYYYGIVVISDGTNGVADSTFMTAYLPPAVTTLAASNLTTNSAILNATVNPQGTTASYYFQFGFTTNYDSVTATNGVVAGTNLMSTAVPVAGLAPGTVYHYSIVAIGSGGTSIGADSVFTTGYLPPVATTLSASDLTTNSATLNATVNPQGTTATYYFEYGLSTNYGLFSTTNALAAGTNFMPSAAAIAGLAPGNLYHFCVVAVSSGGTTMAADATFTTVFPPPTVTTRSASSLTTNSARLAAALNPQGTTANYYFQFGPTTDYGSFSVTNALAAGTNSVNRTITVSNLAPATLYHFRAVAVNSGGMSLGVDATFTTPYPPPSVATLDASNVTAGSALLNGTVNAQGAAASCYFLYGATTNYGLFSATNALAAGTGPLNVSVASLLSTSIGGLVPGMAYHYCVVATSSGGTSIGLDATFTTVSLPPFQLTSSTTPGGNMQLAIATVPGATFTVLSSTDLTLPLSNWTPIGTMNEITSGQYLFTDPQSSTNAQLFYCVRSP